MGWNFPIQILTRGEFILEIEVQSIKINQQCCGYYNQTCYACELYANHFCLQPSGLREKGCSLGSNATRVNDSNLPAVSIISHGKPWPVSQPWYILFWPLVVWAKKDTCCGIMYLHLQCMGRYYVYCWFQVTLITPTACPVTSGIQKSQCIL